MYYDKNELYNIKTFYKGQRIPLFNIATWKNGLAFKNIDFSDSGMPIIKIAELNNGISATTAYTNKKYDNNVYLTKGDFVFSWSGNPYTSIDIYRYNLPDGWLNQHIFKVIPDENLINKDYFFYLMKYIKPNFIKIATNKQTTGLGHVTLNDIKQITFTLPKFNIQENIAKILVTLDDKIELNNSINNNLEQQAQAIFKENISKNCNYIKNGCIGDYCSVKSGFAFKGTWWQDSGVKVIKIKTIDNDTINFNDCSYVSDDKIQYAKDFIVKGGDLLIAMTGATIGKFAVVPKVNETLLVNQRVGKFFLGEDPIQNLPFLYCTLKEQDIINEIINKGQGSAQPNISGNDIMSTLCYLPEKQNIIEFNNLCIPIFETIINNKYENCQLTQLRDTLLPKLMSGEIDVSKVEINEILEGSSDDKLSFSEK